MEYSVESWKQLPKDLRWENLTPKLKCPQCITFQCSQINQLERHVFLHCKCRPTLLKNEYISQLRKISTYNEDLMDLVKLTLEAKMLQWKSEQLPIITQLIEKHSKSTTNNNQSLFLDVWHLWEKEISLHSSEYQSGDLLRLAEEADSLSWEPRKENHPVEQNPLDDSINSSLMSKVIYELRQLQDVCLEQYPEYIDVNDIERLQHEAFLMS